MNTTQIKQTLKNYGILDSDIQLCNELEDNYLFKFVHYFVLNLLADLAKETGYDDYIEEYQNDICYRTSFNEIFKKIPNKSPSFTRLNDFLIYVDDKFFKYTKPNTKIRNLVISKDPEMQKFNRIPLKIDPDYEADFV